MLEAVARDDAAALHDGVFALVLRVSGCAGAATTRAAAALDPGTAAGQERRSAERRKQSCRKPIEPRSQFHALTYPSAMQRTSQ